MALDEIRQVRIDKLQKLEKRGTDPYPGKSWRSHEIGKALADFDKLADDKTRVVLVGRVFARREHGGSTFLDLEDASGRVQIYFKKDVIGTTEYDFFNETVDIGDFLEVYGFLFKTKKDERTLEVEKYRMLSKSLLPMPEKWHGIVDDEERFRRRYLDLLMDPSKREMFVQKSKFWQAMREFLIVDGGLEVETPVLERVPGGADAEPFKTHMNALDIDLYLRISPELNLKKLLVAGFDKVFEIGRIFRNEGIDREHLQDYSQMEMYWAYYDYESLMVLLERMYKKVIEATIGSLQHEYQGQTIDWSDKWQTYDYYEMFARYTGLDLEYATEEELKSYAKEQGIDTGKHIGRGRLIDVIFKKKVRPTLLQPGFLILPPVDIEPLAKRWSKDDKRVERFQIVAGGTELGKGFSELNDPTDQRTRFEEQMKLREAGDVEAQMMNEEFVETMEQGMPPAAGFGVSERLFSFLMDLPVRETTFFPLMKPREEN